MRALVRRHVDVAVPAALLWDYVTTWERQGEWIPFTRVELADPGDDARRVGGRIRARSALGPLGFWDTMTVTAWQRLSDGGRCEVLHTGSLVRGEGVFEVVATSPATSRFVWAEMVAVPLGGIGALGWRVVRPVFERCVVDVALRRLRVRVGQPAYPRR